MSSPRLVMAAMAAAVVSSCSRPSAPEFYGLESSYEIALARDGEAAYETEEMSRILEGLRAVPSRARESERARELVATIERERARLLAERDAREALDRAPPAEAPSLEEGGSGSAPPAVRATADAGPPRPVGGMSEEDFARTFAGCATAGGQRDFPGQGTFVVYQQSTAAACVASLGPLGAGATRLFLFRDGKLSGQVVETQRTEVIDAGFKAPPREPEAPVYPGMPGFSDEAGGTPGEDPRYSGEDPRYTREDPAASGADGG